MNLLTIIFFVGCGFILGTLAATVAHLSKEIEQARHDGHRR